MLNKFFYKILFFILLLSIIRADYKMVGYYPSWGMYHIPGNRPTGVPGHLLTHINYAFVRVDEEGVIHLFDPWADVEYRDEWDQQKPFWGHFEQLIRLKKKYPHLKTLVSVGGWTLSDSFSAMAEKSTSRTHFVTNCVAFCKKYQFDGVDLDWEYPGFATHKGRPCDKEHFTLLIQELSEALHEESLLCTIAAPAANPHRGNIDLATIHPYLDWINVMTYDFHGAGWSTRTNHLAPLYAPKEGDPLFCVDESIKGYIAEGVPVEKIVMGVPWYGRSFRAVASGKDGLYSTHEGEGYSSTQEKGVVFFSDIEKLVKRGYLRFFDPEAHAYYLYHPEKAEFISYDDPEALKSKCDYIRDHKLGGMMFWELTNDTQPDYLLLCTIHTHLHPLNANSKVDGL